MFLINKEDNVFGCFCLRNKSQDQQQLAEGTEEYNFQTFRVVSSIGASIGMNLHYPPKLSVDMLEKKTATV